MEFVENLQNIQKNELDVIRQNLNILTHECQNSVQILDSIKYESKELFEDDYIENMMQKALNLQKFYKIIDETELQLKQIQNHQ